MAADTPSGSRSPFRFTREAGGRGWGVLSAARQVGSRLRDLGVVQSAGKTLSASGREKSPPGEIWGETRYLSRSLKARSEEVVWESWRRAGPGRG